MTKLRYLTDGTRLALDEAKCTGCGMCREVCPQGVFEMDDEKSKIIDRDACMECGACAVNCPAEAIRVKVGAGCATGIIKDALKGK